jgi:hypothetical protein
MDYYNYTYEYSSPSVTTADAATAAVMLSVILFTVIVALVAYIVTAIFLGKIFKKAGVPAWAAWVPFYNTWKLLEIGGQPGFWAVLAIITPLNIVTAVFTYISMYHIGKKLGKDGTFVLLAIFLPIVWMIWLGVDKSKWNDKASTAPSLHKKAA